MNARGRPAWLDWQLCQPPTLTGDGWYRAVLASLSPGQKNHLLIWLGENHRDKVEQGLQYLAANPKIGDYE